MNDNTLAILYSDTYKQCHPNMYPKDLAYLVSYWTPRRSMIEEDTSMVFFGLQAFICKYLIHTFNNCFFNKPRIIVKRKYQIIMKHHGIAETDTAIEQIMALHTLGYLPLHIRSIPEGTAVPMGVPCVEVTNTHPDFAWVVQWIECLLQAELWKPCCHATMATKFRKIANKYYAKTVDETDTPPSMAMSDFGMRGMSGIDEAQKASAAWLLSFNKTSTIPALDWIETYYKDVPTGVGIGAISTEHSVMSANYAVDGNETDFLKRLLTEIYPNSSFSMVSDTYDYWNMVNVILPSYKKEILEHNGTLLVRPDSGDIVDISIKTVKSLWRNFGGTTNSKGYKVLDPHIRVIYGDGCTIDRVETIYDELEKLGFAANNIFFGVGAFSFAGRLKKDGTMHIYTRDTYGIAMKATAGKLKNDTYYFPIYKDPKTDTTHLKKSHKGCVRVTDNLCAIDGYTHFVEDERTLLKTRFLNGAYNLKNLEDFDTIRKRVNSNEV